MLDSDTVTYIPFSESLTQNTIVLFPLFGSFMYHNLLSFAFAVEEFNEAFECSIRVFTFQQLLANLSRGDLCPQKQLSDLHEK